jgi:hypothetical protein
MYAWHTFVRPSWLTGSLYVAIRKQVSETARNEIQVFHTVSFPKLAFKYRTEGIEFATGTNMALRLSVLRFYATLDITSIILNTIQLVHSAQVMDGLYTAYHSSLKFKFKLIKR